MKNTLQLVLTVFAACAAMSLVAEDIDREHLATEVPDALRMLKEKDSTFESALEKAYGYAVFPNIGKGGFIIAGGGGEGEVYEKGKLIGHAKVSQTTVGAQVGGQVYIQVILFETREALRRFRESRTEFSAHLSAVAAAEGAGLGARYENGVAVIILPKKGLMAEASIGGQKFHFFALPPEKKE